MELNAGEWTADIVALADCGISVTSGERAQTLVDFLREVIDRNQDAIPAVKAASRMGWNEEGFAPYVGGVRNPLDACLFCPPLG